MDHKIEKAIKRIIDLYTKLEDDLLKEIASHFLIDEEFQNSDVWRIKKLQEMGLFNQQTIKIIAKDTGKTEEEVIKALEEIGIEAKDIPTLEKAYKSGKLKTDPQKIKDNPILNQILVRAEQTTNKTLLELNKRILESTKKVYLSILEEAYLKTSSGTHSYVEAITEALNKLGDEGITTLTYRVIDETGEVVGFRKYSIEAAIRRDVLTEARNTSHELTEEIVKELEPEYLYLSEHLNCREQHFPWQGTVIKTEDLEEITGYGEVDGLGGINCRHYFEPYWGEARGKELKEYSQEQCEDAYEKEQHQRYLERGLRKWKRKAEIFKANGDIENYNKAETKTLEWAKELQDYTNKNNMRRDFGRESIYQTENKEFERIKKEWINNMKVGEFDIDKYQSDMKATTKDVILTPDRREHLGKHKELLNPIERMPELLNNPDGVYIDTKYKDTLWLTKEFNDTNVKMTIKLNTKNNKKEIGYKNSIMQIQPLKRKRLQKYIENKRIIELFDKYTK